MDAKKNIIIHVCHKWPFLTLNVSSSYANITHWDLQFQNHIGDTCSASTSDAPHNVLI